MDSLLRSEALRNRQKQMLHPLAKWQGDSVSKKWQMPLFRGSKFGQPEVARIRLSKKPLCIVAKWLLAVGESRNTIKVATCGGRVS